jgi:hypothetical protein
MLTPRGSTLLTQVEFALAAYAGYGVPSRANIALAGVELVRAGARTPPSASKLDAKTHEEIASHRPNGGFHYP